MQNKILYSLSDYFMKNISFFFVVNDKKIKWVNQIKRIGNYIDRNLNDSIDCTHSKSIFTLMYFRGVSSYVSGQHTFLVCSPMTHFIVIHVCCVFLHDLKNIP